MLREQGFHIGAHNTPSEQSTTRIYQIHPKNTTHFTASNFTVAKFTFLSDRLCIMPEAITATFSSPGSLARLVTTAFMNRKLPY